MAHPFYENHDFTLSIREKNILMFGKHLHNQIELLIVLEGETYAYADDKGGLVKKGQAFISFPNQVHRFEKDSPNLKTLFCMFEPDAMPLLYKVFKTKLPENPIITVDLQKIAPIIEYINGKTYTVDNKNAFEKTEIIGLLSIIVGAVLSKATLLEIENKNSGALNSVLQFCNNNFTRNITLNDIANSTHLSRYYISHLLKKEIGISFTDYINSLRIREAINLIKSSEMSVTEIAYAVGFNSLRSFNRHFAEQTGLTPREAKKADQDLLYL